MHVKYDGLIMNINAFKIFPNFYFEFFKKIVQNIRDKGNSLIFENLSPFLRKFKIKSLKKLRALIFTIWPRYFTCVKYIDSFKSFIDYVFQIFLHFLFLINFDDHVCKT